MSDRGAPRTRRRWGRWAALAGLVVLLGALAWLGIGTLTAAREVRAQAVTAQDSLGAAAQALDDGDVAAARAAVATGAEAVDAADAALASTPVSVVGSLPVVGQAVADARALTSAAGHATSAAGAVTEAYAAASGDDGGPRLFARGAIDEDSLDTVLEAVTRAAADVRLALADLDTVRADVPGTAALAEARDSARAELQGLSDSLDPLAAAAPSLPAALGFGGPRTYVLGILNSAELRASGGPPLAAALIRFDQGRLTVVDRGQTGVVFMPGNPRVEYEAADGSTRVDRFVNATADADFRSAGVDLARSWEASTGTPVDGVITLDPVALAAVLEATGPIDASGYGEITAESFVRTVLVDAYDRFAGEQGDRQRLNTLMIDAMAERLTTGDDALAVLRALGGEASGRHVQLWVDDPTLQAVIAGTELGGALADPDPHSDRIAVFSQNVNRSKVDVFQERTITSTVALADDGAAQVQERVDVRNAVPPGKRDDVRRGYRTGWSRSTFRVYLSDAATDVSVAIPPGIDGAVLDPDVEDTRGRRYARVEAWIPPGQALAIDLRYRLPAGTFAQDGRVTYRVVADPQALVVPARLTITVSAPGGRSFSTGGPFTVDGGTARWSGEFTSALRMEASLA